ncbi:MAG: tRNA (guanosine(37)-N1)-methyltransferase TrmD [Candidatus Magasanikbacteria bacterium]|nr:tRNA (guanosine(37)-N1)-methyltransferase TrmD [Candidatus Magasanikbacteria bacterium]
MKFDILTIFPDLIHHYADESILGRAQEKELLTIAAHDFRAFAGNKWGHVDDKPYGGGPGMILGVEPIYKCLKSIGALRRSVILSKAKDPLKLSVRDSSATRRGRAQNDKIKIVVLDPAGKKFDQRMAEKFSKLDRLVLIAGRYEGFDARIYKLADERVSVGDYVLAGGELPALTVVEAVARLIPGVLGNPESLKEETFNPTLYPSPIRGGARGGVFLPTKEYPQYTRPEDFMGQKVPKVLLSGDHKKIAEWRKKKSL